MAHQSVKQTSHTWLGSIRHSTAHEVQRSRQSITAAITTATNHILYLPTYLGIYTYTHVHTYIHAYMPTSPPTQHMLKVHDDIYTWCERKIVWCQYFVLFQGLVSLVTFFFLLSLYRLALGRVG